jgi:ankyrin repeat protein
MSTNPQGSPRQLPEHPDLRHLKDQAKDLKKTGQAASLAMAQLQVARQYGFASWPKLKAHVESLQAVGQLKQAIDSGDLERVKQLMTRNPELHRAPLGYGKNGPLTWVAECRVPREAPSEARLAMAKWMIENGSDVHQGGDGPLMRAALADMRIPMMELLVSNGAHVNALWNGSYPIICAPCETLAPRSLKWLLDHGANPRVESRDYGNLLSMLICTYTRNSKGKHACLEIFADTGLKLPDTPAMAFHRGRIDLLEAHLIRQPSLLEHRFQESEIYPTDLGIKPGDGLHVTAVAGSTLLHLAIEFDDIDMARWLIERGADVNARTSLDADGFGGHTPLFHTVVTLAGPDDSSARLLLEHGADPNARATIRKQLRDVGDPEKERMREFHNVTPIAYARQFQQPSWVNGPAIAAIAERGGTADLSAAGRRNAHS